MSADGVAHSAKLAETVWMNQGLGLTLAATGKQLGVGRERARQLRNEAILRMERGDTPLKIRVAAFALLHGLTSGWRPAWATLDVATEMRKTHVERDMVAAASESKPHRTSEPSIGKRSREK